MHSQWHPSVLGGLSMKRGLLVFLSVLVGAAACQTDPNHHRLQDQKTAVDDQYNGSPGAVTGYVRDIACLLRNPKAAAATTSETKTCMKQCVAGGSPLGILESNGTLYIPISNTSPDISARRVLLPYVGKYVHATGRLFERGELHAISISHIAIVKAPAAPQ